MSGPDAAPRPSDWLERLRGWRCSLVPPSDPWTRVATSVNWGKWPAAPADWRTIFAGASSARVTSLSDVCAWLAQCHYCPDEVRGDGRDRWTHPLEFEGNRIGDCEDHALWAWRKLTELGYAAEFVLGLANPTDYAGAVNHAWVHVHDGARWWLLEGCARPQERMLVPSEFVRRHYLPTVAVDHRLQSYAYANLYHLRAGQPLIRLPVPAAQGSANAT